MAFVDDTSLVDGRYKGSDYLKILNNINRNALETNLVRKKLKCDQSPNLGIHKENVKQCEDYDSGRKRSKSESYKFVCCTPNQQIQSHRANRTRTFSGNRTMHDKAVNVYVMPENMPELLLDGYSHSKSKQNIKWPDHADNACCQPTATVPQVNDDSDRNGKDSEIESCQRERSVGIKRMRDESPSLVCIEPTTNAKYSSPLKVPEKHAISVNSEIQPVRNGLSRICNRSRVFEEPPPEPPSNYCDTRIKSKRSKTFNSDCDAVLVDVSDEKVRNIEENSPIDVHNSDDPKQEQNTDADKSDLPNGESKAILEFKDDLIQWNNGELHPSLRESLFPCVPPYIRFSSSNEKAVPFPVHVQKLLRWKLSTITPLVVRKVVSNSGYRLLRKSTFWGGTWGKHTKSVGFKTLFDYQKMNHFPGTFQIGRKDRLWKSLQKLMSKHGKHKFDLMPTTYVLPQDKRTLKLAWKKLDGKEPWIIKPPASARGTGIKVVHKWSQIPDNTPLIVQKYISRPYLINDTKFDLRLYVLVTSVNPLRIYLYDNGLVRFASVKYSTELNTLGDRYMHLTNYSINKLSSKYKQNEDATACQGHKWTLQTLWMYMRTELDVDVSTIWNRLIDLIIKTILSGESPITNLIDANLGSRYNSYELFGIDVLFDVDLKPWLLEVNISPSLHSASPLDLAVKAPLVQDLMNIVGFQIPHSKKFTERELCAEMGNVPEKQLCFDSRLYTRVTSYSEKQKQYRFVRKTREEYLDTILEDLTPDDIRHLIQYEDELTQLGSFQKIFPTYKTHEYLQYLDNPKYYNQLFDAWETKYHNNREVGIRLLKTKCEKGVHLQVSKETVGLTKDIKENGSTNEASG